MSHLSPTGAYYLWGEAVFSPLSPFKHSCNWFLNVVSPIQLLKFHVLWGSFRHFFSTAVESFKIKTFSCSILPADKKCRAAWWEHLRKYFELFHYKIFYNVRTEIFYPSTSFPSKQHTRHNTIFLHEKKRFYIQQNQWNILLQLYSACSFQFYVYFEKIYYTQPCINDRWAFKFYFAAPYELLLKDFRCSGVWNN